MALTGQGLLQEKNFRGNIFGGSTGKSCNSPGAITLKNVYRTILVIISPQRFQGSRTDSRESLARYENRRFSAN